MNEHTQNEQELIKYLSNRASKQVELRDGEVVLVLIAKNVPPRKRITVSSRNYVTFQTTRLVIPESCYEQRNEIVTEKHYMSGPFWNRKPVREVERREHRVMVTLAPSIWSLEQFFIGARGVTSSVLGAIPGNCFGTSFEPTTVHVGLDVSVVISHIMDEPVDFCGLLYGRCVPLDLPSR